MDTIIETPLGTKRAHYRHHATAFKRAVVIESLKPGASVSRIARQHDINANQIFAWRKAYREGKYGDADGAKLLEVTLCETLPDTSKANAGSPSCSGGSIELTCDGTTLRIDGRPDADTLRLILAHWPR